MCFSVINFWKIDSRVGKQKKKKGRRGEGGKSFHSGYIFNLFILAESRRTGMPPVTVHPLPPPRRSIDSKNEIFPEIIVYHGARSRALE